MKKEKPKVTFSEEIEKKYEGILHRKIPEKEKDDHPAVYDWTPRSKSAPSSPRGKYKQEKLEKVSKDHAYTLKSMPASPGVFSKEKSQFEVELEEYLEKKKMTKELSSKLGKLIPNPFADCHSSEATSHSGLYEETKAAGSIYPEGSEV